MQLRVLLALASLAAACGGDLAQRDAGGLDARAPRADAGLDGGPGPSDGGGPPLVRVGHTRELRAAWVASVFNLTWPSRTGLSEAQSRGEIAAILDTLVELRMNAVVVQIRPESDALYRSEIEPWSRFLTGTQGTDPGWDPLAAWIDEAHARGIEVHAWMNPYRGMATASATTTPAHVTRTLSSYASPWGTSLWMDPGSSEVRAHVVSVVRDVVARYDVDGIHFDDYFYPYPDGSRTFPDDETYDAYVGAGGTLSLADWRRDNVNTLVREVSEAIAAERADVRFGISPFGIYRPGMPPGISGLDAYATLYCDAPRWLEEGWVDYVAPQLYWPSTQTAQAFGALIEWWAQRPRDPGRSIFAGINLTRLGSTSAWTADEIRTQVELTRGQRDAGARGVFFYTAEPLLDDLLGVRALVRDQVFLEPAATPPLGGATGTLAAPTVTLEGTTMTPSGPSGARVRTYAVYVESAGGWALDRLTRGATTLEPGRAYAVSAIDTRGVESMAVELHVP